MNRKILLPLADFRKLFPIMALIFFSFPSAAQKIIAAGPQYGRSSFHQTLWGKHYRTEWTTPVSVKEFLLDTAAGGLTPYQEGGGRQTTSLRLHDRNNKEYVIRSIDKSFGKALPPIYQHTFIETIINDQVSLGHPYAAVTIPLMADAAGVYHTNPRLVFIPEQSALDSFNKEYGNRLYLFEQRPDENWEEAAHFGNSKNIVGTEKMLEKVFDDNDNRIDQVFYIRARLFDMLIGDASRHEDQWRWASFKQDGKTLYKAIPRDRDQAYAKFEGLLLGILLSMADLSHLQTFGYTIPDVRVNNYPARNLDRQMANEPTLDQWLLQAKQVQQALTDDVIERSVRQMPAEVFPISGEEMISKLRSRRDHLQDYAKDYYLFLAKEVEVVGTKGKEFFFVQRLDSGKTFIRVSEINKKGEIEQRPFYARSFLPGETKEVRLYGLEGNDIYRLEGESAAGITIRIIGGKDKDSMIDLSSVKRGKKRTIIYDDHDNNIIPSAETKLRLSEDMAIHTYQYDGYKYNDQGIKPVLSYNFEDRIYTGLAYKILRHRWRRDPYRSKQQMQVNYSIMQKAFSFVYQGDLRQIVGKWNLDIDGNYDLMRWTNYYGLGNETKADVKTRNYYQMQSRTITASLSVNHPLGKYASLHFGPVYNMVKLLENKDRFLHQSIHFSSTLYEARHFAGIQAGFVISHLNNNNIVPSKGIFFSLRTQYLKNINEEKHVNRYQADLGVYLSLSKHFILFVNPAAATVTGQPEFYQFVSIGSNSLRGYRRDRFWGKSFFYTANELQYVFKVRSHLFNGKAGLVGFYDIGRVWKDNEISRTWHSGYGGGFLIAPFNRIMVSVLYGLSTEGGHIHVRLARSLQK